MCILAAVGEAGIASRSFPDTPPQEPALNVEIHWRVMSQERKESLQ